jgi:hypothetical protein
MQVQVIVFPEIHTEVDRYRCVIGLHRDDMLPPEVVKVDSCQTPNSIVQRPVNPVGPLPSTNP